MRWLASRRGLSALLAMALPAAASVGCEDVETTQAALTTAGTGGGGATGAGGTGATGGTGGQGGGEPYCGDGTVTSPELCDDGNEATGDGCENDCSFSCTKDTPNGDAKCNDGDPCNGAETCSDEHACVPGASLADGADCGEGKLCKAGTCGDPVCGDGFVDPGEDCDDANLDPADGCDACSFTCLVDADCDPADPCAGDGLCAEDHTCSTVSPLPDGAACAGGECLSGACFIGVCGNGVEEPGEECDDADLVSGDGCDADCQITCEAPAADCPAPPPCNEAVCSPAKTCATTPDPSKNGEVCGQDLVCSNGACIGDGAVCGNGVVEAGEDCDFGAANGPGVGCEVICKYSCSKTPDSCADKNLCNGVEACNTVVVSGDLGQKCSVGSTLPACTPCGPGVCAAGGLCVPSACGDGCVDPTKGESCEPPGAPGCDAACQTKICGNGVRESGEECDDGNTVHLDGCSAACRFEQIHRVRYLVLQYATDVFCPKNQLGAAIVSAPAQGLLQTAIDDGLQSGAIGVLFQFLGLDDLSGTVDPTLQLGALEGIAKIFGPYDGFNDLDHWYGVAPTSVDANKVPLVKIPAAIVAKQLTAGPGSISLTVSFGDGPATLGLSEAKLAIALGPASKPLVTSNGLPPGHVFWEHLDPGLQSFATAGQTNANGAGKLCGDMSAGSLAAVPIPEQLTTGAFGCAEGYTLDNSMLDVLVSGCTVFNVPQIAATEPDEVDPAAPVAGAGPPYKLLPDAQRAVSSCLDKNGAQAPLATCLSAAAYSSFFKVATNRVIAN